MNLYPDKHSKEYPDAPQGSQITVADGNYQGVEVQEKMGVEYNPELYNYLNSCYERSRAVKKDRGIDDEAEKNSLIYQNKSWSALGIEREDGLSSVEVPIVHNNIETGLNLVTAKIPKPDITPSFNMSYEPYANLRVLKSLAQSDEQKQEVELLYEALKRKVMDYTTKMAKQLIDIWDSTGMQSIIRIGYREKAKVGLFVLKSVFDSRTQKIVNEPCHVTTLFPSPNVGSIKEHKNEVFIYGPVMSVGKVQYMYNINSISDGAIGDMKTISDTDPKSKGYLARMASAIQNIGDKFTKKKGTYVRVCECYLPADVEKDFNEVEDYELVEDPSTGRLAMEEDQTTGRKMVKKVPTTRREAKFPSGRKRVAFIPGHFGWIIEEEDSPYETPPFIEQRNFEQLGDFWGMSDIAVAEDMIMRLNTSVSNLNDNLRYTGNPVLVKSEDAQQEIDPEVDIENNPLIVIPGSVWTAADSQGLNWLQPPALGFDAKWWIDWLVNWIDRSMFVNDAIRGFNTSPGDSGRKVIALQNFSLGNFRAKVDEQTKFIVDLYSHWAFIYQNLWPQDDVIVQGEKDNFNDPGFEEFDPNAGRELTLNIKVSGEAILPDDPESEFIEAVELYKLGLEENGIPLISPQQLVDRTVAIKDKASVKKWLRDREAQATEQREEEAALARFEQLVGMMKAVKEGSAEEDNLRQRMTDVVLQSPEILNEDIFFTLKPRLKIAIINGLAKQLAPQKQNTLPA